MQYKTGTLLQPVLLLVSAGKNKNFERNKKDDLFLTDNKTKSGKICL